MKIFTILPSKFFLTGPMQYDTETVNLFSKLWQELKKNAQAIGKSPQHRFSIFLQLNKSTCYVSILANHSHNTFV